MASIPVNPQLPNSFHNTPNAKRPEAEVRQWWCLPYVVGAGDCWSVYCLDGGAWDRSTWHTDRPTQAEAVKYAEELHAIYWTNRLGNELPLPFPYEMRFSPVSGPDIMKSELVGPATAAQELKAR